MKIETVDKIMELMRAGKTQREAQDELGINYTTIGRVARANGFKVDKAEQLRKGALKHQAKQIEMFGTKPVRPTEIVTTSHVRLPQPEKWSGENFILDAY